MTTVGSGSSLVKRCVHEAVFEAASAMERCVDAARQGLEESERRSTVIARRMALGDARIALDKRAPTLRTEFPTQVEHAVSEALRESREEAKQPQRPHAKITEDSLSLLADAEVTQFVEASRLQQGVLPMVEHVLSRLDTLISSAMGLPVVRPDLNPFRPDVLCRALLQAIDRQPEDPELRSLWVKHMTRTFGHELNRLYKLLADQLEAEGVQEARYRLKLTAVGGGGGAGSGAARGKGKGTGGAGGSGAGGPGGGGSGGAGGGYGGPGGPGGVGGPGGGGGFGGGAGGGAGGPGGGDGSGNGGGRGGAGSSQRRRPFPHMSRLARAKTAVSHDVVHDFLYQPQWIAEHDEPLPEGYYEAVQKETAALYRQPREEAFDESGWARWQDAHRAISPVDRPPRDVDVQAPLPERDWGAHASAQNRARTLMALKAKARKVSEVLGLDAVRTLVSQVAGDQRVLAPVREAFVALEPALMRMALADPRFFGSDEHPARRLVESVAQRSFKFNDEFSEEFESFMAPVRATVRELSDQNEVAERDFSERLQALQTQWKAQDDEDAVQHQRGLQSIHFAQERQALADKIAWEFSLRSDLPGVPGVVVDFLFQDWSLVIAHAQLTDKRGQLDPGGYLAVVTDLLWSVKRDAALKQPARLFEVVPSLLQTLRRGLDMLGKDPEDSEPFFTALMRYHDPVLRLRRRRSAIDAEASGFTPLDAGDSSLLPPTEPVPIEVPKPKAAEQPWLGRHELTVAGFEEALADADTTMGAPLVDAEEAGQAEEPAEASVTLPPGETAMRAFAPTEPVTVRAVPPASEGAALEGTPAAGTEPAAAAGEPAPVFQPGSAAENPEAADEDEALARRRAELARLRQGDWVDLLSHGKWRRAQLLWTSDNGALFMFVSRGGQPHTMTRRTCEKLMKLRQLRIVDAGAVVDKAMRQVADQAAVAREARRNGQLDEQDEADVHDHDHDHA
ncbi:MAG: DUF1631 family protein [Burkholderiaceae bacterium]